MPDLPAIRQVLAKLESTCQICRKKLSASKDDPNVQRCPGCRLAHYCSLDCQAYDAVGHKKECYSAAANGFSMKLDLLFRRTRDDTPFDFGGWARPLRSFVTEKAALPDGLSLEDLAEAVAQGRATFRHSLVLGEDHWGGAYTSILYVFGACVARLEVDREHREAFVAAVREFIAKLRDNDPLWGNQGCATLFADYGTNLHLLGRTSEAVTLGRRLVPVIEAAIEKLPEHPSRGTRQTLYMVHEAYSLWLFTSVIKPFSLSEGCDGRAVDAGLKEADTLLQRVISMREEMTNSDKNNQLGVLHLHRVRVLNAMRVYDEAYRVAQRGMELRSRYHAELVSHAICSLRALLRDAQAEALIEQFLTETRRSPQSVAADDLAAIHLHHSVLLCRRGMYAKAAAAVAKATKCCERVQAPSDSSVARYRDQMLQEASVQKAEILERLGDMQALETHEASISGLATRRPSYVARGVAKLLAAGERDVAVKALRVYAEEFRKKDYTWIMRHRWREGDAVKPLQLLRDLLEEGSDERDKVEALIERTASEDEAIRQQALEELQTEMRQGRQQGAAGKEKETGAKGRGSKASRKKKKKRDRKKQQRLESQSAAEQAETVGVELGRLSLEDEEGGAEEAGAAAKEEEEDECPMCLLPFGEEYKEQHGQEEVLGCGHRYHDVCMDRWLCKCQEKGLQATCPTCRREVVRGAGAEQW